MLNKRSPNNSMQAMPSLRIWYFCTLILLAVLPACEKNKLPPASTSLMIVNARPTSTSLTTDFNANNTLSSFQYSKKLGYAHVDANNNFPGYVGDLRVKLFQLPDTLPKDKPVYDLNLHFAIGTMHTLFLAGTEQAPDTLFKKEVFPDLPAQDSSAAIRFVNLCYGTTPLTVNLKEEPVAGVVSSLSYKQLSEFKMFRIPSGFTELNFEIRYANTGNLIATCKFPFPDNGLLQRYRHHTIIVSGEEGGTGIRQPTTFRLMHQAITH